MFADVFLLGGGVENLLLELLASLNISDTIEVGSGEIDRCIGFNLEEFDKDLGLSASMELEFELALCEFESKFGVRFLLDEKFVDLELLGSIIFLELGASKLNLFTRQTKLESLTEACFK